MDKLSIYRGNNKFAYCKISLHVEYDGKKHYPVKLFESPSVQLSGAKAGINVGEYTCKLTPITGYTWDIIKNGWSDINRDDIVLNEGFNELYLKETTNVLERFSINVTLKIVPAQITVDLDYKKSINYDDDDHKLIKSAVPSFGRMLYSEDPDCFEYNINGLKSDAQYYKDQYIGDKISDLTIYEIYAYKYNNKLYAPNNQLYTGDMSLIVDSNIITLNYPLDSDLQKVYYGKYVDNINNTEFDEDNNTNYYVPWDDMQKYVDITFGRSSSYHYTDTYIFIHTFKTPLVKNKYYYYDIDVKKVCIHCSNPLRANYPVKTVNTIWDIPLGTISNVNSLNNGNLQLEYDGIKYPCTPILWSKNSKLAKCVYDIKNIWYHLSGDDWETFNQKLQNGEFSHNVWSEEIPVKKDVGDYTVYYRTTTIVKGSEIAEEQEENPNYLNTFGRADVKINSHKLSCDDLGKLPEDLSISYNSMKRKLIKPGQDTNWDIYYKLSTDTEWSTEIPEATITGNYTIQFYIKGDGVNYLDSDIYELHSQIVKHVIDKNGIYVFPDYQDIDNFIIENNILPQGFTLLNHLDCDGSFFFDLGWQLFEGINIDLNIRPIKPNEPLGKKTTYWRGIFGVYTDDGDNDTGFGLYSTDYTKNPWYLAMNMFGYTNSKMYKLMSYHSYNIITNLRDIYINDSTCENDLCTVNDKYYTLEIDTINPNNKSVYLLSVNSEVPVNPFIGKFYGLNVYNNDQVLLHKYVPCKSNVKYYIVNEHTSIDNVTVGKYYIAVTEYNSLSTKEKHEINNYLDRTPVYLDGIFDMITRKFIGKTSINKYNQTIQNNDKYLTFDNLSYVINESGTLTFDVFNYNQEGLTFIYGLYDITSNKYYGLSVEKFEAMTGYSKLIDINSFLAVGTYDIVPVCQVIGSESWNSTLSITLGNSYNLYYHVIKRSPTADNINKFIISIESKSKDYNFDVDSYDYYDSCAYDHTVEDDSIDINI